MTKVMLFSAAWCGPCKAYKPKFDAIAESSDKAEFERIDIDENSDAAVKYNIRGVPTLVVVEDDKEVARGVGVAQIETVIAPYK